MKISGRDLSTLCLYLGTCGDILFLLSKLPSPVFVSYTSQDRITNILLFPFTTSMTVNFLTPSAAIWIQRHPTGIALQCFMCTQRVHTKTAFQIAADLDNSHFTQLKPSNLFTAVLMHTKHAFMLIKHSFFISRVYTIKHI